MTKRALITGIGGQDGSYLAELLLMKGYDVHGVTRAHGSPESDARLWRIAAIRDHLHLHDAELEDPRAIAAAFAVSQPDECYHLAATSTIRHGADDERQTLRANIEGTHSILAQVRDTVPTCRVFVAASSEVFGHPPYSPQSEATPFNPRSAYGVSKAAACWLVREFREVHGVFSVSGILYNHESPRRGEQFVTRIISKGVANIVAKRTARLPLRSLEPTRDWGHAGEFVDAMWRSLQVDSAGDYILATGKAATVRDFCDSAFASVGLDYRDFVDVTSAEPSGTSIHPPVGNPAKAHDELGWIAKSGYREIAAEMVAADLQRLDFA